MRRPKMSSESRRKRRAALLARDGSDCFYCLDPLGGDQSIEHLEERDAGDVHALVNLVLANHFCNNAVNGWSVARKLLWRGDALLTRLQGEQRAAA